MQLHKRRKRRKNRRRNNKPERATTLFGVTRSAFSQRDDSVEFHQESLVPAGFLAELEYLNIRGDNPALDALEELAVKTHAIPTFPALMQDTFTSLFQNKITVKEPKQLAFDLNKTVLETMHNLEKFQEIKPIAVGRVLPATLFSQAMDEWATTYVIELRAQVKEHDRENEERKSRGETPLPDPNDAILQEEMKKSLEEAVDTAAVQIEVIDEVDRLFGEDGQPGSGWGNEDGSGEKQNPQDRIKLAQELLSNPSFLEILEMAGRLSRLWTRYDFSSCRGLEEVTDTGIGNDLERVLLGEFARLSYDKGGFFRDYAERKLTQVEMEGYEQKAKGPIGILEDQSGSMRGQRDKEAKAITFASMMVAKRERRDFFFIAFDSSCSSTKVFKQGDITLKQAIEIVSEFRGGGTDFYKPLIQGIKVIEREPVFENADIIMISDGICSLSQFQVEDIVNYQERLGFHVLYLAVGVSADPNNPPTTSLDEIADEVVFVNNLMDERAKEAIYRQLNRG